MMSISLQNTSFSNYVRKNTPLARILEESGLNRANVMEAVMNMRGSSTGLEHRRKSQYKTLDKYSRNLTRLPARASWTRFMGVKLRLAA